MIWLFIAVVAVFAGVVGGIAGFGSSVMLLPLLTYAIGPKAAVPAMAVASLIGNLSRVAVWWRDVDWRAVAAYSLTAVPAAALGARTLVALDARLVELALGTFLLAVVPFRRIASKRGVRIGPMGLAAGGAALGFLTGIVASTGPVNAPLFLGYGLSKGPYISTEAASSAFVYLTKTGVFGALGALPRETALTGIAIGVSLFVGAVIARRLVERISPDAFRRLLDALLVTVGFGMLINALR